MHYLTHQKSPKENRTRKTISFFTLLYNTYSLIFSITYQVICEVLSYKVFVFILVMHTSLCMLNCLEKTMFKDMRNLSESFSWRMPMKATSTISLLLFILSSCDILARTQYSCFFFHSWKSYHMIMFYWHLEAYRSEVLWNIFPHYYPIISRQTRIYFDCLFTHIISHCVVTRGRGTLDEE